MPPLPRPAALHFLAALTGVALVASGCGGGGGGGGGARPTITPVTTAPVSTTAPPPGEAQLQSIVVQPGDLPAGWTAKPASPSTTQAADAAAFSQCVGAANTSGDVVATAYSPDFVNGATVVAATATSYKSATDVQADTSALTNPKASSCFAQVQKARMGSALPKGASVKSVTFKITPGPNGGPANVVATGTGSIVFTAGGKQLTLNDDLVFLAAPRIETHIDFYSIGHPVPAQTRAAVVNKVSVRVTNGS